MLLVVGLIWVLQVIPQPEKKVDFAPNSGGGGKPSAGRETARPVLAPVPVSRVVANGSESDVVLSEPDEIGRMAALANVGAGSLGMGGLGSGGGLGDGRGPGIGDGIFQGMGKGIGSKNPFGPLGMNEPGLAGTFYDLKQTRAGEPTNMTDDGMRQELREIVRRGFRDSVFNPYFKAPRQLQQNRLLIRTIPADAAPAAFEVQKEVQPKRWIVVYRGMVRAPESGRFRFVGQCDDLMVIRFDKRMVFDYGYTMAGIGAHVNGRADEMNGSKENRALEKEVRRLTPMRIPIRFYQYASMPAINSAIGGLAVGPEFNVTAGKTYPIEIMIGEIPGGSFSVSLLIEKVGAKYQKDPGGAPILPLFRVDASLPDAKGQGKGEAPPFDPDGPVWKAVAGDAGGEI